MAEVRRSFSNVELIGVSQRDPVNMSGFRPYIAEPCSKIVHSFQKIRCDGESHVTFWRIGQKGLNPPGKVIEFVCPEDWAIRKEGKYRPVELYKR